MITFKDSQKELLLQILKEKEAQIQRQIDKDGTDYHELCRLKGEVRELIERIK